MLAAVLLLQAILGFVFSALVLRADPRRWDNRFFALIGLVDGLTASYRAVMVLSGWAVSDVMTLRTCLGFESVLAWLSLEFAAAFPLGRPLRWRWRIPGLAWTAAVLTFFYSREQNDLIVSLISWLFFLPLFIVTLGLLRRNLGRIRGDKTGIYLVAGAVVARWLSALGSYLIARRISPHVFAAFVSFDATTSTLFGYLVIGYAVLRGHLFSVRGMLATLLVSEGLAAGVVALTAVAVETALALAPGPVMLRVLLVACALVPIGLVGLAIKIRPRLEEAILPRRALRRDAVARVAWNDARPAVMLASVRRALHRVTRGRNVRFLTADKQTPVGDGPLPPALLRDLADGKITFLRRGQAPGLAAEAAAELEELGSDLLVTARAGGRLLGALTVEGGKIDRESLLAARDLADRLALRLDNFRLFGELEESRRLATLGAFAAAVAHDLRTPLTSIQMNVQMLRKKATGVLATDDMEHFDIALDELKRLGSHINELLDYAKPVQLHASPVDVREVADDTIRGMEPILAERHLVLARDFPGDLPAVRGDAQRLRQVLWNLLDNAARASADGGSITLRTRRDKGRVALEVADRGAGIDPDDMPHLFEPFFTTRPDGTGLGLAICQKLVRAHDGEITVSSKPGEGSTFTVLLPIAT